MNVTLEDAYREACTAIGEGVVEKRLLVAELSAQSARVAELEQAEADRLAQDRLVD